MHKEMSSVTHDTSLAIVKQEEHNGKRRVIACGYNKDMKFGYFICKEHIEKSVYIYSEFESFHQKTNERTFHDVLEAFIEPS